MWSCPRVVYSIIHWAAPRMVGRRSTLSGCCGVLRQEFRLRQLGFMHGTEEVFYKSMWRLRDVEWLTYRVMTCVFCWGWLIFSVYSAAANAEYRLYWPVFLTNWCFTLLTLYFTAALAILVPHLKTTTLTQRPPPLLREVHRSTPSKYEAPPDLEGAAPFNPDPSLTASQYTDEVTVRHPNTDEVTTAYPTTSQLSDHPSDPTGDFSISTMAKLVWLLFDINVLAAVIISLVFYLTLYPSMYKDGGFPKPDHFVKHTVNVAVMLVELALNAVPLRLLHALYPVMFGATYVVFSVLFWAANPHDHIIYSFLNWSEPGRAMGWIVGLIAALCVLQFVAFGAYRLKLCIHLRVYARRS